MGRKQRVGERKKLNKIKVKLIDYTEPAEMIERKSKAEKRIVENSRCHPKLPV
jgi:hypothetical protein